MLDIGKVSEKIVFQKFGNFSVHVLNRVNSKKIGIYIFKIKKIGTEHRHGDFSRESSDVVLTHMEYMLVIGKVFVKIVLQKFGNFTFMIRIE